MFIEKPQEIGFNVNSDEKLIFKNAERLYLQEVEDH